MLEKLENELKNKGCSQKTVDSYMLHNNDFLKFINKEPEKMSDARWVKIEDIPEPLFLPLKNFLDGKKLI